MRHLGWLLGSNEIETADRPTYRGSFQSCFRFVPLPFDFVTVTMEKTLDLNGQQWLGRSHRESPKSKGLQLFDFSSIWLWSSTFGPHPTGWKWLLHHILIVLWFIGWIEAVGLSGSYVLIVLKTLLSSPLAVLAPSFPCALTASSYLSIFIDRTLSIIWSLNFSMNVCFALSLPDVFLCRLVSNICVSFLRLIPSRRLF